MPGTPADQQAHVFGHPQAALELHSVRAALRQHPHGGGALCLRGAELVGPDRSRTGARPSVLADPDPLAEALGRAVLVGVCSGAGLALGMAARTPERVLGVVAINPGLRLCPPHPHRLQYDFEADLPERDGWATQTRRHWQRDWPGAAAFFLEQLFPEPHSTKQVEDCVEWALGTNAENMLIEHDAPIWEGREPAGAEAICRRVRCPVLVIAGSEDRCQPPERGRRVAELTGGEHVIIDGGGHLPQARDPVKVNLLLRDFLRRVAAREDGHERALPSQGLPGE